MIAFLGTGLLGANFTRALLKKGEQVNVWNKTSSKAQKLEAHGARAFDSVADAVRGASRIHLTLKDDASVNEVLEKASTGFEPGVIIVDHTTTSAHGAAERTELWKQRGVTYIHAPVFMGPQNALESTGYMLISGDAALTAMLEPELAKMTGKVLNFGTDTNKAAGLKLIGNLFLIAMTAGVADMLALASSLNIDASDLFKLFDAWNPAGVLPARIKKMTSNTFHEPTWELNMSRKDAGLMIEAAELGGRQLPTIKAIATEMDRWIATGHGTHDWTVIGKDAVKPVTK